MPVETRGVVRDGDADVTGVYLGLALEGFFDLGLHLAWADLRRDDDVVADAHHAAHVLDHPLDLKPLIAEKPENVHLILSGRNAHDEVIRVAHLVSEVRSVKHPYDQGIEAEKGIDY